MKTKTILNAMKIMSWIIFIGLCIKLGSIIISSAVSLFLNDEAVKNIYLELDLSNLYNFSIHYYLMLLSLIISILVLKTYLFYLVIKLLTKLDLDKPFVKTIAKLITSISYVALWTGGLAYLGRSYSKWILKKEVNFEYAWESSSFLFMAGILFIIAFIFKRGVEIQSENELTV